MRDEVENPKESMRESTRERSPNYPAYALPAAIEFVKRVYEAEKRSAVPPIVVGQALSGSQSTGLSGPSRSKIATMRQYALLDEPAKGRLRVSDIALAVIQRPSDQQYKAAVQEAAAAPPLFKELQEEYAEASDPAIRYFLMTDRSFTEDGANRVLKSYRETLVFANLGASSYTPSTEPERGSTPTTENERKNGAFEHQQPFVRTAREQKLEFGVTNMAFTWPLPDGVVAQVSLLGKPTRPAINRLITFLEFMRDDIGAPSSSSPAEVEATAADVDEGPA